MLEQHHEKLSRLLKFQTSHPVPPKTEGALETNEAVPATPTPSLGKAQDGTLPRQHSQNLPAAHRRQRDNSSSIAGTLASARGIPSNKQRRSGQPSSPAVAQQNAEGKIVTPPRYTKPGDAPSGANPDGPAPSEKAPTATQAVSRNSATTPIQSKEALPNETPKSSDDPFNRFYTTFESLFSKLSAPLAFAGLPLNPDADDNAANDLTALKKPSSKASNAKAKSSRAPSSRRATAEPAYSELFSPAALAAVREEPGNAALGAPGESFYVVPTTGGTMPYASILARRQNHSAGHHNRTLSRDSTGLSEDFDEFVDARETPGSDSPVMSRTKGAGPNQKSMEELQLENESLRGLLDEMSRRLWQFEMGAQMGSVALHQSIRASLNRGQFESGSHAASSDGTDGRIAGLEEEMKKHKKELERMGRENEKLKGVVGRYRERWEKLKEGARTRRQPGGVEGGKEKQPELGGDYI